MAKKDKEAEAENKDAKEGGEEAAEGKKSGKKKLIIIILGILLLVGGGGAGAYFMGLIPGMGPAAEAEGEEDSGHGKKDKKDKEETKEEGGHGEEAAEEGGHGGGEKKSKKEGGKADTSGAKPVVEGQPIYYELPEFLVNLNTGGKGVSFLKMTVTLELNSEEDQELVDANLPKILDICNGYLRELRSHEVAGSAGLQRLKEEIQLRINKILEPKQVKSVLFNNIMQQ